MSRREVISMLLYSVICAEMGVFATYLTTGCWKRLGIYVLLVIPVFALKTCLEEK